MSYKVATQFKRFTVSGAIFGAGETSTIVGIQVNILGADVTVNIYDATGVVIDKRIFGVHQQPGVPVPYIPLCYKLRDGGYVEIDTSAEVFIYFA